jgi:predicted HicB family RNase H-like nuclease
MKEGQLQTTFTYHGYRAPYQYDVKAKMWIGGIHRGNIFLEFGGDTEQDAEEEFHSLLDVYLQGCAESGEKPEPIDAY